MNPLARLGGHTFWLAASRFAAQALMVIFTALMARRLGGQDFGAYAFIVAVIAIGNTLTTFGTDMHLIRGIAAGGDLSPLPAALLIQLGFSALFIAAVMVIAPHLPNQTPQAIRGLQIYSLALIPLAFFSVCSTALRGREEMGAYAALNALSALLQTALILFLLQPGGLVPPERHAAGTMPAVQPAGVIVPIGGSLIWAMSLLLAAQALTAILAGVLCTWRVPGFWGSWRLPVNGIRALLLASAPVALLAVLGVLYQRLSLLMLPALGPALVTGWFAAAARTVDAAKLFHVSAFTALYPAMAGSGARQEFRAPFRLLLLAAALAALGLSLLAGPLVRLLFGPSYAPAVPALRILAWALIPYTVTTFLSLRLLAEGREWLILRGMLVGLATLGALNLVLVPLDGLAGAGWACLLAETAQAGVFLLSRRWAIPRGAQPSPLKEDA